MTEPVDDPKYWAQRLQEATRVGQPQHAVYCCGAGLWKRIEDKHRQILARHVRAGDAVLDCACGWGRLVFLLPDRRQWQGPYLGVDFSSDFILKAMRETVVDGCGFQIADLRRLSKQVQLLPDRTETTDCVHCNGTGQYDHGHDGYDVVSWDCEKCHGTGKLVKRTLRKWDWAILVSVRPMIRRNMGDDVWAQMESEVRKVATRLLYLEYDPSDEGSVE
jgi:hypothetical protein